MEFASFESTQIVLRLVGAFYAFAGFVAARSALVSRVLDRAIAAIGAQKPNRIETIQTIWLLTGAILILAGGAALMLLLDVAAWLFAAAALGQAMYLFVVAPRHFDAENPPDPRGRQQSRNAFVIYLAATAFVAWAALTGKLLAWSEVPWQMLAIVGLVVASYAGHTVWQFTRPFASAPSVLGTMDGDETLASESKRIKVMADYDAHPLWALDGAYGDFAPEDIGLSPELTRDLTQWADDFTGSLNRDDPASSHWSDAQFAAHEGAGRKLAARLARERPDRTVFVHTRALGVVEVRADDET